jgi:tripartite ATP-independent transporter DctM subunit
LTAWLFIPFLLTILFGLPIAICLGVSSLIYLIAGHLISMDVIAQRFFSSIDSFVLLAIPFFVLSGELMNRSGLTNNLIRLADALVGRICGGLAQVNIVASVFFAGLTGAAVADTSALGSILIPSMEKKGFKAEYAAAVTAASSVIGPIIPPSIIMVVYGSIMGISIGALFAAGFVPGVVIALCLMVIAYFIAKKQNHPYRTERITSKELFNICKEASLALIMPIIIGGVVTPTEAAAVAVAYALVVGFGVMRSLTVKDLFESLVSSAVTTAVILFIIGFANVFGWVMAIEKIPQSLSNFFIAMNFNRVTFLLVVNIFLLFMGMIMETGANAILLGPILMPIAMQLGINPIHFALIMLVNLNIGLVTPPLGVCLFVACPIAKINLSQITKAIFPFLVAEIIALFLITFLPDLVLIVPKLLGYV